MFLKRHAIFIHFLLRAGNLSRDRLMVDGRHLCCYYSIIDEGHIQMFASFAANFQDDGLLLNIWYYYVSLQKWAYVVGYFKNSRARMALYAT